MKNKPQVITITSGKGGVGKSVVAVNLAETLARSGYRVALVDVDFGQSACTVLLNEYPSFSILDAARQTVSLADTFHQTLSGVTLIVGATEAGGVDDRLVVLYDTLDDLLYELRFTFDFILIDTPAGVDGPVRWAVDRSDLGLVILVGEPTAVADSYQLIKFIWQADPAYPINTLVNFADSESEAFDVYERFCAITEHFLQRKPTYAGWIPFASAVRHSVQHQVPVVRTDGPCHEAFEKASRVLVAKKESTITTIPL